MTLFAPTDLLFVQLYVYIQHYVEIHILMNQSDYLLTQFSVHTLTHPLSLFLYVINDPEATFVTIDHGSD